MSDTKRSSPRSSVTHLTSRNNVLLSTESTWTFDKGKLLAFKSRLTASFVHDEIRVPFEKIQDGANVVKRVVEVK